MRTVSVLLTGIYVEALMLLSLSGLTESCKNGWLGVRYEAGCWFCLGEAGRYCTVQYGIVHGCHTFTEGRKGR